MPSITAAIKQAADEIEMRKRGTPWLVERNIGDDSELIYEGNFWDCQDWCRQERITRALELLGVPPHIAPAYASREGTYSKVVRSVMRERATKAS